MRDRLRLSGPAGPTDVPTAAGEAPAGGTVLRSVVTTMPRESASPGRADASGGSDDAARDGIQLIDLLLTGRRVPPLLEQALSSGDQLDAYLLAVALNQLAEDRLHPDPFALRRAAAHYRDAPTLVARAISSAAATVADVAVAAQLRGRPARTLADDQQALARHIDLLADGVRTGMQTPGLDRSGLTAVVERLSGRLEHDVARLPACFRDFDQHPDDVDRLVATYLARASVSGAASDRFRPIAVVGVRTSGSYLAPLAAAALRARGFGSVRVLTVRPGRPARREELAVLRETVGDGGEVLLVDDPPVTGGAIVQAAETVHQAGVPRPNIVLLTWLFGDGDTVPQLLRRWRHEVQPWPEWSVHERLSEEALAESLAGMLPAGRRLVSLRRLTVPDGGRRHAHADVVVRIEDEATGIVTERELVVEGAGQGYLGRHALAVARGLPGLVPEVIGFADGLLYRARLTPLRPCDVTPRPEGVRPEEVRVAEDAPLTDDAPLTEDAHPPSDDDLIRAVARYADARRRVFAVGDDPTPGLTGRDPAWQVSARALSALYGPLAPVAQLTLLEPLTRRLLTVSAPSVVDGDPGLDRWGVDPVSGGLRKAAFHQGAFSRLEIPCYDPVFDLAAAALPPLPPQVGTRIRAHFELLGGRRVEPERWLLYQLTQLVRLSRDGALSPALRARHQAAAVNEYLASLFLADLEVADDGPLCAIDLDGVLESDPLGFRATTPAGALALRALVRHGYRPVLATGRSLPEVAQRCATFGLVAGIAEYGAALYLAPRDTAGAAEDLRPPRAREAVDQARAALANLDDVRLDEEYRYTVRAQRIAASGRGGPLTASQVEVATSAAGSGRLMTHAGEDQTDLSAADVDKGTGLRALARRLGGAEYALAVGDAAPDLPMLAVGRIARAPRNADATVHSAGIARTRHGYQAGLLEACAEVLGHRPGSCSDCRPPHRDAGTRALLAALALREAGVEGLPITTARLVRASLLARPRTGRATGRSHA
jgi:hypothetical protein